MENSQPTDLQKNDAPRHVSPALHYVDDAPSPTSDGKMNPNQPRAAEFWVKAVPAAFAIFDAIVIDVLGEGFDLVSENRNQRIAAEKFATKSRFQKKLYSALIDAALSGDGYLGKVAVTFDQVREMANEIRAEQGTGLTKADLRLAERIAKARNDLFLPRDIVVIKSATMRINYDIHGTTLNYVQSPYFSYQIISGNVPSTSNPTLPEGGSGVAEAVSFSKDEIIHISLNNIADSPYGYTPAKNLQEIIATIWYIIDYAGTFFQNDATPDMVWMFKNEAPDSQNVKKFREGLKEHRDNKHKSMIVTGEAEFEKLNSFDKDMEFGKLIDKLVALLMMSVGMPQSRLPSLITGDMKESPAASEGYYRKIAFIQAELEEQLNEELWSAFGNVKMRFRKVYKRDESREADIVNKLVGKPVWTVNEGREYLGLLPLKDPKYDEVAEALASKNPSGFNAPTPAKSQTETSDMLSQGNAGRQQQAAEEKGKIDPKKPNE